MQTYDNDMKIDESLSSLATTHCKAICCFVSSSYRQTQMYPHSIFHYYIITHLKYFGICGPLLALCYPCQGKPNLRTHVSVVLGWKRISTVMQHFHYPDNGVGFLRCRLTTQNSYVRLYLCWHCIRHSSFVAEKHLGSPGSVTPFQRTQNTDTLDSSSQINTWKNLQRMR